MLPDNDNTEELVSEEALSDINSHEHFRYVADPGQAKTRIDRFLVDKMLNASRSKIQEAAAAGNILVNDVPVKANYKIKPNDIIRIVLSYPPRDTEIIPQDIPLDVVYEDEDVLVVNKAAGMVVHPGHGNFEGTLLNALAYRFRNDKQFEKAEDRLGLVHRIDKDTSGLLVVAKNDHAKTVLSKQFFNKTTERLYVALVWGAFEEDEGRIEGNIGRNIKNRLQMTVFEDGSEGKEAVTHYQVLENFSYITMVQCQLETGRTHQIRAHMKHIGHPLFNDARYGGDIILKGTVFAKYKQFVQNCFKVCPRQALHARTLGFVHPRTGETMRFESQIPEDMSLVIEKWRNYVSFNS